MTQILRVSSQAFAEEIQRDLPTLIKEYPGGIYISNLQEMYGESYARTLKAVKMLAVLNVITLHQAVSRAHYILPKDYIPTIPFPELTPLQRDFILYVANLCRKFQTSQVRTNYSELSRILECSYGGLKSCLERLATLQYLAIINPSHRGKQSDLLIEINQPIVDYIKTLDLTQ